MTFLIVGLGSLAFSQLNFSEDEPQSAEDLKQQIERLSSISSQKIEKSNHPSMTSLSLQKTALMQSIESTVAEGELKASDLMRFQNLTNLEKIGIKDLQNFSQMRKLWVIILKKYLGFTMNYLML